MGFRGGGGGDGPVDVTGSGSTIGYCLFFLVCPTRLLGFFCAVRFYCCLVLFGFLVLGAQAIMARKLATRDGSRSLFVCTLVVVGKNTKMEKWTVPPSEPDVYDTGRIFRIRYPAQNLVWHFGENHEMNFGAKIYWPPKNCICMDIG